MRLTDGGERNQRKGDWVERVRRSLMQLGAELARRLDVALTGRLRMEELAQVALARLQVVVVVVELLLELVEIDGVLVERHDLRRLVLVGAPHDMALAHDEIVRRWALHDDAVLGEVGLGLRLVAAVVHDEAEELAVE